MIRTIIFSFEKLIHLYFLIFIGSFKICILVLKAFKVGEQEAEDTKWYPLEGREARKKQAGRELAPAARPMEGASVAGRDRACVTGGSPAASGTGVPGNCPVPHSSGNADSSPHPPGHDSSSFTGEAGQSHQYPVSFRHLTAILSAGTPRSCEDPMRVSQLLLLEALLAF